MAPRTEDTARFYDALSGGRVKRGLWGVASRFDPAKIIDSPSVDRHFRRVVGSFVGNTDRVLDVGCGPGGFTAVLAELAQSVVGLDVSQAWVETCTQTFAARGLTEARAVLGSSTNLPFPDASFEVATLIDVIHHLDDPGAALREIARVLVPGGRLLVFEPNKWNPVLTLLCVFDRNEWGFLARAMGTIPNYRRLLGSLFRVDVARYSALLIGPDGPAARRIAEALTESPAGGWLGWLGPKIFLAATKL
jgi:ubiquinone/menaquinone biosynthesis C-methylase UbiE